MPLWDSAQRPGEGSGVGRGLLEEVTKVNEGLLSSANQIPAAVHFLHFVFVSFSLVELVPVKLGILCANPIQILYLRYKVINSVCGHVNKDYSKFQLPREWPEEMELTAEMGCSGLAHGHSASVVYNQS